MSNIDANERTILRQMGRRCGKLRDEVEALESELRGWEHAAEVQNWPAADLARVRARLLGEIEETKKAKAEAYDKLWETFHEFNASPVDVAE